MPASTCCTATRPHNSARQFKQPAPFLRRPAISALLASKEEARVAEVGAGCLRNALYLQELGFDTTVFELEAVIPRFQPQYDLLLARGGRLVSIQANTSPGLALLKAARLAGKSCRAQSFDTIVMTFVLETMCQPKSRRDLLRGCRTLLKRGGKLLLAVRGGSDVAPAYAKGKRCSDGYLTPLRTFIRSYTKAELGALLRSCRFGRVDFLHRPDSLAPELLYAIVDRE